MGSPCHGEVGVRKRAMPTVVLALLIAGFAEIPASAQHMNAPDGPCQDAGSTTDTSDCLSEAHRRADAELNETYRRIMAVLGVTEKASLRAAQLAWIDYREKACDAEAELYRGRSGAGPARLACLEAATRARTRFLKSGLWWKVEKFGG